VFICSAVFLEHLFRSVQGVFGKTERIIISVIILCLLGVNMAETHKTYFVKYPQEKKIWKDFCYGEWAMAEYLNSFQENLICYVKLNSFNISFYFLTREKRIDLRNLYSTDLIPICDKVTHNVLFMLEFPYENEIWQRLNEFYPGGNVQILHTPSQVPVVLTYFVDKKIINDAPGASISIYKKIDNQYQLHDEVHIENLNSSSLEQYLPSERPLKITSEGSMIISEDDSYFFRISTNNPLDLALGNQHIITKNTEDPTPHRSRGRRIQIGPGYNCKVGFRYYRRITSWFYYIVSTSSNTTRRVPSRI